MALAIIFLVSGLAIIGLVISEFVKSRDTFNGGSIFILLCGVTAIAIGLFLPVNKFDKQQFRGTVEIFNNQILIRDSNNIWIETDIQYLQTNSLYTYREKSIIGKKSSMTKIGY